MKITLTLATDESIALRRMASEQASSLDETAHKALRDWLILAGYLEFKHEMDDDAETQGNA